MAKSHTSPERGAVKPHDRPTALDLGPRTQLSPGLEAYFAKCMEKLGFVPNVLAVPRISV